MIRYEVLNQPHSVFAQCFNKFCELFLHPFVVKNVSFTPTSPNSTSLTLPARSPSLRFNTTPAYTCAEIGRALRPLRENAGQGGRRCVEPTPS